MKIISTYWLVIALFFSSLSLQAQIDCFDAVVIEGPGTYIVDSIYGSQIPTIDCVVNDYGGRANWYSYTPDRDTVINITTDLAASAGEDTRFSVHLGECTNLSCVGGDDDSGSGFLSTFTFNVQEGLTYFIVFDNRWSSNGFSFSLQYAEEVMVELSFTATAIATIGNTLGVADMNGDGLDDVVSIRANSVRLNLQQADSPDFTVVDVPTTTAANLPQWSLAIGDFDGNGLNDLLYGGGSGVTFMQATDTLFGFTQISFEEYVFSQRSNFIDINNDGHLDAFVCHDVQPNVFFLNDGENNLSFNQGSIGDTPDGGNYGSLWVDYDNDGDQDLFIAKCRGGDSDANINQLFRNNGDGTFTDVAPEMNMADRIQTWSAAWGDFDNDGDMDAFVGASSFAQGRHKMMRNDRDTFADITAGTGFENLEGTSIETITHDFNNDGYLDIFGAGDRIALNNGDMTFRFSAVPFGHGPVGDLNNDGFLDIVAGGTAFLNQPNGNNYLKIYTKGTVSNSNGIGARVEVFSAMGKQIRDVRSGDGFRFMSSLTTHFGLGQDEVVDYVVVKWPSGIVDTIYQPEINTQITIEEGSFVSSTEQPSIAQLMVYPNPSSDWIYMSQQNFSETTRYAVFSTSGQLLQQGFLTAAGVDISQLPTGIYQLLVSDKGDNRLGRFVKQ